MPTIHQLPTQVPGMVGVFPNQKFALFGDNLATVTTAGYLNQANLESNPVSANDIIQAFYSYNLQTKTGTYGVFTVSISNLGVITLNAWADSASVQIQGNVNPGDFALFSATANRIYDGNFSASNPAKTKVVMADAATTLNNWTMFTDTSGTVGNILKANGTEAANAVTASGKAGVITTSSLNTAAGGSYAITWTNTQIASSSAIQLTLMGGTNTVKNITLQATAGAGTSTLTIYNNDAADPLNGTLIIGYQVV